MERKKSYRYRLGILSRWAQDTRKWYQLFTEFLEKRRS